MQHGGGVLEAGLSEAGPSTTSAADTGTAAGGGGMNGWASLALTLGLTHPASAPAPALPMPGTSPSGERKTPLLVSVQWAGSKEVVDDGGFRDGITL